MYSSLYFISLVFSLSGLLYLDFSKKIFIFRYKKAVYPLLWSIGFFLAWDIAGILLGIFATNPDRVLGIYFVTPDLPLEEFCFLALLTYQSALLLSYRHES